VPRYFRRNDRVNHAPRDSAHACSFGREYAFVQKRIAECVKKKMVRLRSLFYLLKRDAEVERTEDIEISSMLLFLEYAINLTAINLTEFILLFL